MMYFAIILWKKLLKISWYKKFNNISQLTLILSLLTWYIRLIGKCELNTSYVLRMEEDMKIGIIGFGHLGKALTKGLLYKKIGSKDEIFILAKSERTREIAENEFGVQVCSDINDIIQKANILFWVLKGNVFDELSKDIQQDVTHKINVSFMAGIPITSIQEKLGDVFITSSTLFPNDLIDANF